MPNFKTNFSLKKAENGKVSRKWQRIGKPKAGFVRLFQFPIGLALKIIIIFVIISAKRTFLAHSESFCSHFYSSGFQVSGSLYQVFYPAVSHYYCIYLISQNSLFLPVPFGYYCRSAIRCPGIIITELLVINKTFLMIYNLSKYEFELNILLK